MSDKQLADIICRSLLAIVSGIRKKYELPEYHNIVIEIKETDSIAGTVPLAETEQIG